MKTGFIYIWYDRKRKMYYIGCHLGKEDDGYICSSRRMRDAYRRRPDDFKRRILKHNIPHNYLLEEEYKWLNQIKDEELGKKYYNLNKHHFGHWSTEINNKIKVGKKISSSPLRSEKIKKALIEYYTINIHHTLGKKRTAETIQKMKDNHTRPNLGKHHTKETKEKMSLAHSGKKQTSEHIQKSSQSRTGLKRTEESKKRMSNAQKGTKKPWVKGRTYIKNIEQTKEKMKKAALIREKMKREKKLMIVSDNLN